eukprot:14165306-Ditylum_brightwellii.AAC.1
MTVAMMTTKTTCLLKSLPPPSHCMGFKGQKFESSVKPHNLTFFCTIVPPTSHPPPSSPTSCSQYTNDAWGQRCLL